jgi:hypothetical protein
LLTLHKSDCHSALGKVAINDTLEDQNIFWFLGFSNVIGDLQKLLSNLSLIIALFAVFLPGLAFPQTAQPVSTSPSGGGLPAFVTSTTETNQAPLSVKPFLDRPDVTDIALSPDGKNFVTSRSRWESEATQLDDEIRIASVVTPTTPSRVIAREDLTVNWVIWPKNDRILASITVITRLRRDFTLTDQIISINPMTGEEKVLLSRPLPFRNEIIRIARLMNVGTGSSPDVLVTVPRGKTNALVKLNIYTGAEQTIETGTPDTWYWLIDDQDQPSVSD